MNDAREWPEFMDEVPSEFWTDDEVLTWLNEDEYPDCVGCINYTEDGTCLTSLDEDFDADHCYEGGIVNPLENKISEFKLKGDKNEHV